MDIIFEKVTNKLAEYLNVDVATITPDTEFKNDLHADSLTVVELLFALENEYGVTIPDDVVNGFKKVGDVVTYLNSVVK